MWPRVVALLPTRHGIDREADRLPWTLLFWSVMASVKVCLPPDQLGTIKASRLRTDLQGSVAPPTRPGVYWFQSETTSRAMLVEVRVTNGELTVLWPNEDQPIANLKGRWKGPIPPSSGPGRQ